MVPDGGASLLSSSSCSTQEPSHLREGKGHRRRKVEMGGQGRVGSASLCQKFHPDFQPQISKHLSHHRSLTPQLYRRR